MIYDNVTIVAQFLTIYSFLWISVSRLHCESESFKMDLILDINSWLYPMDLGEFFVTGKINCFYLLERSKVAIYSFILAMLL